MKNSVIAVTEFYFIGIDFFENVFKFLFLHIGFVVHNAPVADNEDFIGIHGESGLFKYFFFFYLEFHLKTLILSIGAAGPWSNAACNEFGSGFAYEKGFIAHIGKGILYTAHGSGFSCTGTACNDHFNDFHDFDISLKKTLILL